MRSDFQAARQRYLATTGRDARPPVVRRMLCIQPEFVGLDGPGEVTEQDLEVVRNAFDFMHDDTEARRAAARHSKRCVDATRERYVLCSGAHRDLSP